MSDEVDSGKVAPEYFRFFDNGRYHGLFMVAFGRSGTGQYGFFWKDCLNNEDSYGPFVSVEDAVANARGVDND